MRLSAIGDVVHGLPLARSVRRVRPDAQVTWIVQREAAPLLERHPWVDRTILFPRRGGIRAILDFLIRLRAERFDLAIDLQGNTKSALVTAAAPALYRLALRRSALREGTAGFLPARRAPRPAGPHSVDRTLSLCRLMGDPDPRAEFGLDPQPDRSAVAAADLAGLPDPPVALSVGAGSDVREWPDGCWIEAAAALRARGRGVVVLSGPRHAARARAIAEAAGVPHRAGTTDLPGLLAHLAVVRDRGGALVACDSAPLHLAVALALPCVALAGPQDPRRTGAYGHAHEALHVFSDLRCAPCLRRTCRRVDEPRACMARITPALVLGRLDALLSARRRVPGPEGLLHTT